MKETSPMAALRSASAPPRHLFIWCTLLLQNFSTSRPAAPSPYFLIQIQTSIHFDTLLDLFQNFHEIQMLTIKELGIRHT